MTVSKLMTRRMADLITPSDLGENLLKFNKVIFPCGRMPAGYESVEGLTLSQLGDIIIEHLDVAGLIPDLSGGGNGENEGVPTDVLYLEFDYDPAGTIPLQDIEILMFDGSATMRVNDTFELLRNPTDPNFFVCVFSGSKFGFFNMHSSNAPIKLAIRLIPENQDQFKNMRVTGNTSFKWVDANAAYVGTLLPFPKPTLDDVTYTPQSDNTQLIEGTGLNLKEGFEYSASVTFYRTDLSQQVVLNSENVITSVNKNFTISGDIPVDMGPYYVSLYLRDTSGYRDVMQAQP